MSEDIFANRPIESDTTILGTMMAHYDDIPVLVENWTADGIAASSCIVPIKSIEEAGKTSEEMIGLLKELLSIEGPTTEKETEEFLFLNFNFEC